MSAQFPPPGQVPPPPGQYPPPPGGGGAWPPGYNPNAKSKVVAGILGILLGGWGVHRFYLGYTNIGIIQIIVTICTCGIGAIWGLIEGIMILTGSEGFRTDANGVPLRDD